MAKALNSKLVIIWDIKIQKYFCCIPNWSEGIFVIIKVKTLYHEYVISDLSSDRIGGAFYEKELQRQAKLDLGLKKYSREKVTDRLHVIWKGYKNSLISWINMKDIRLSQNFPELYEHSSGNVKVELDLSNFPTKADLTVVTGIDTFMLASKTDLATMKTKVGDIDVDKL